MNIVLNVEVKLTNNFFLRRKKQEMSKDTKICGYCQKSMPEDAKKIIDPFDLIVYGVKRI